MRLELDIRTSSDDCREVCRTAVAWLMRLPLMICCKSLCGWRYKHILSMGRRKSIGRTSLQLLVLSISLHNFVETGASAAANAVRCAAQDHTGPHISGRRIFLAFVHNTLILHQLPFCLRVQTSVQWSGTGKTRGSHPNMAIFTIKKHSLRTRDDQRTKASELSLRQSIYPLCLVTVLFFLWVG